MNDYTARLVEQAIVDTEPEPPAIARCDGRYDPTIVSRPDHIDHWYCDPVYCVDAALDILAESNIASHEYMLNGGYVS